MINKLRQTILMACILTSIVLLLADFTYANDLIEELGVPTILVIGKIASGKS